MKRRVCIVGAGPSGLVGAKVLLKTDQFHVTVYEKAHRIGGIWAIDEHATDGWLNADTPTNLSRFSVGFSDLQWQADFLQPSQRTETSSDPANTHVPMFPRAWQVNRYLEEYRKRFIPESVILFNHTVVQAERTDGSISGSTPRWRITTRNARAEAATHDFDLLMVGSGFFSKPRSIELAIPGLNLDAANLNVNMIHSSQYRTLASILPKVSDVKGETILMIGGGNSSGETAAAIAQNLSDSRYSPLVGENDRFKGFKVVHVTPRPLYALPPYHPTGQDFSTFVPLDLRFYDLSKRPAGAIVAGAGRQPQALKDLMHTSLQSLIAGDQSSLGSQALTVPTSEPRGTVMVALTESFSEFVRSGDIEPIRGRVTVLENADDGTARATVQTPEGAKAIDRIAGIVHATGFTPATALDFLPSDVKQELRFDPDSMRLPLVLEGWQSTTAKLPDLALLGFYEGPYWGVMEMQARLTASRWLNESSLPSNAYEESARLLDLRKGMQKRDTDVPQYWFGDYLGYLEEVAAHLGLQRHDGQFNEREGCTSPARYLSTDSDKEQARSIMDDLYETWHACFDHGRYVARAAFRALQGNWKIRRTIDSALPSFPSGILEGTASFHPRIPSPDASGKVFDLEYLYIESGTLTMSNGAAMQARRRYVYRYSEAWDQLSVWFVKPDSDLEVDYLFHNLAFSAPNETREQGACIAKADHLCVKDMYWTEYRFPIKGVSLLDFETKHTVRGPSKDYVATTNYTRGGHI